MLNSQLDFNGHGLNICKTLKTSVFMPTHNHEAFAKLFSKSDPPAKLAIQGSP